MASLSGFVANDLNSTGGGSPSSRTPITEMMKRHRRWDQRARREIGPGDVVVFAEGDDFQSAANRNGDDIDDRRL